jgi:hypothetical protein
MFRIISTTTEIVSTFELEFNKSKLISHPNGNLEIIGNPKYAAMAVLKYMLTSKEHWDLQKSTGIYLNGISANGLYLNWENDLSIDYEPFICQSIPDNFKILKEEFNKLKKMLVFS